MSLSRTHQSFSREVEYHLPAGHHGYDIGINIRYRIGRDFKREQSTPRIPVIRTELFKVIAYLAIDVGQAHLCFYTLLAASVSFAAFTIMVGRCAAGLSRHERPSSSSTV
ncbi:MAG TPA: hypothetical protein VMB34_24540 [Acetobacteraceae bacterium]|nr:hypothetical protein [Acetobacteraceae bacterium]